MFEEHLRRVGFLKFQSNLATGPSVYGTIVEKGFRIRAVDRLYVAEHTVSSVSYNVVHVATYVEQEMSF